MTLTLLPSASRASARRVQVSGLLNERFGARQQGNGVSVVVADGVNGSDSSHFAYSVERGFGQCPGRLRRRRRLAMPGQSCAGALGGVIDAPAFLMQAGVRTWAMSALASRASAAASARCNGRAGVNAGIVKPSERKPFCRQRAPAPASSSRARQRPYTPLNCPNTPDRAHPGLPLKPNRTARLSFGCARPAHWANGLQRPESRRRASPASERHRLQRGDGVNAIALFDCPGRGKSHRSHLCVRSRVRVS